MKSNHQLRASVTLSGFETSKGGFRIISDRVRHLDVPRTLSRVDVLTLQNDCALLAKKLAADPALTMDLYESIIKNELARARKIADDLGVSEDKFVAEGGGLLWLVVVVVLLYATDAF